LYTGPVSDAETVAAFLLERVRATRGRLADEGPRAVPLPADGPALSVFATRRVRGIPEPVVRGLIAWSRGERPADLLPRIPNAVEVLERQTRGRRCVSLLPDPVALAHVDPRHPDGLSFALHDLCHLEKFVDPVHHRGQVGFFRLVWRALPALAPVEAGFDATWRADRDYVIADMNGSAIFLFAALKMKLNMAVRRRLAAERGLPAPRSGPLDEDERRALAPVLERLFQAMELPAAAARAVSTRRDDPPSAAALLAHFEAAGG
jgi:hypothetical protein